MEQDASAYGQVGFNLPHDIVTLPSGGVFYKSKKKSVKVGYLTASDENILMSVKSNNKEGIILSLLRSKLYEPELRPEELLMGDVEAILIFLRNTAFGPEYNFNLIDPKTDKKFDYTLSLDELNIKKTEQQPSEDGSFVLKLPKSGSVVKIKPLSLGESLELEKLADNYPVNLVAPKVTWKLNKQILEVDGSSDRNSVAKFVENLPILDSKTIRNFLNDNEPSLDLSRDILAPSGEKVTISVAFGVEFFRPFF
jgi:hypothetical protein